MNNPHKLQSRKPVGPKLPPRNGQDKSRWIFVALVLVITFVLIHTFFSPEIKMKKFSYGEFFSQLNNNPESHYIKSAELIENRVTGVLSDGAYFQVVIPENDPELIPTLRRNILDFRISQGRSFFSNLMLSIAPVLILIFFFWFFVYRGVQQGGGRLLSFGKSRARQLGADKQRITFKDVAGVEEAKEELQEVIEFLKDPKKFQRLGGRIPKGVLLIGPPGTGKTLLAKAVAGEAGVPFFSISGSDFVEMFVGVGASRVRDLFEQGKRAGKVSGHGAILFIDEIDAVGRQRFAGIGGGHDEREQTLNALLVEMDGFDTQEGVILIAATNRPDVLDPALLRPGRFDRTVVVDRPDISGREQILKVHIRSVKLADTVDLNKIARQTPGFSGADLANLVNEAALLAARRNKECVTQAEMEEAIEKVMAGPERKSRIISKPEKEIVAYHESGHTLCTLFVKFSDPLHKVSIIPRGHAALGYTMQLPIEDRYLVREQELMDKITVLMGGRVAEELIFNQVTSGAHNDLEVATNYAQRMVCEFGMSRRLGNLTFGKKDKEIFLGRDLMRERDYSEQTAVIIDEEVRKIIDDCHTRARKILTENLDKLKLLAVRLLEKEVLDADEVRAIVGVPPTDASGAQVAG
jgi:cell division protease FtsH